MKILFISQPMNGKTNEEILFERAKAINSAEQILGEPVEAIDSFFQDAPHDAKPLWFLGKSLELLSTADVVYFAKGWGSARGCKIEHESAINYNIDVLYEEEPLEKCGKWRTDGNKRTCSVCEFTHCYGGYKLFKYCPECGAKMDVRSVCSTSKEADETEEQK